MKGKFQSKAIVPYFEFNLNLLGLYNTLLIKTIFKCFIAGNTISNWIMIIPPIMAAYLSWKNKMEIRTVMSFLSIGCKLSLLNWITLIYSQET